MLELVADTGHATETSAQYGALPVQPQRISTADDSRTLRTHISTWLLAGHGVVLATLLDTSSSAVRRAGTRLALGPEGKRCGDLGNGRLQAAALEIMASMSGQPADSARLLRLTTSGHASPSTLSTVLIENLLPTPETLRHFAPLPDREEGGPDLALTHLSGRLEPGYDLRVSERQLHDDLPLQLPVAALEAVQRARKNGCPTSLTLNGRLLLVEPLRGNMA